MTMFTWSTTASSNNTADATINWREGQAPSTVNNSARAMMAAVAKWRDDLSGNLVTGGSSTAYTITSNQTFTALTDGIFVAARMSATNGASPTLNVDSLGAKAIQSVSGTAIPASELTSGGIYLFTYDSSADAWIVHGHFAQTVTADDLGLGTGDSPQFTGINLGHASDTTLTRASAGDIAVEGNTVYRAGGTDVAIADGGTGAGTAAAAFTALKQAASDTATGVLEIAVQSEMESASSTTLAVTPGRQHYHPGMAKFWAYVTVSGGTPTLAASYNVTSITDAGTGLLTVTIATDFSSANWCCQAMAERDATTFVRIETGTIAAGSVQIQVNNSGNTATDPDSYHVTGYGDQ